jgi:hypothetical protein
MEYKCNKCNKYYKTYQTLWKHNKEFHDDKSTKVLNNSEKVPNNSEKVLNNSQNVPNNVPNNITNIDKQYKCKYCNNQYNNIKTRWSHEQKCKITCKEIDNKKLELEIAKETNIRIKEERLLKQEEARILKLKLKLQQADKVDNITLNKLNKMLLKHNNRIKNSFNNNSNNTINVQNNFQLVGFGKEEITEVLTNNDKKLIMNSKYGCLEKLIEIVHCGKYNQFKNVILTNMKDNYMYKYDEVKGCFVLGTKSEIMNSLVDGKLYDLDVIYNDLLEKNKIDEKTKNCIEDFVNRIQYNEDKFTDIDGKEHDNYKHYKISEIKLLLFNNQDKITNDISLLLST